MENKKLIPLDKYNQKRREQYDLINQRHYNKNGIACPKCSAELVDDDPSLLFMTDPPQQAIKCLTCNYSGTRVI